MMLNCLCIFTLVRKSSCWRLHITLPVSTLYTLAVRSHDAVTRNSPSGNHSAAMTGSEWPSQRFMGDLMIDVFEISSQQWLVEFLMGDEGCWYVNALELCDEGEDGEGAGGLEQLLNAYEQQLLQLSTTSLVLSKLSLIGDRTHCHILNKTVKLKINLFGKVK